MEAITKLQDIEARHRGDIETIELDTLRTSLTNTKHRKARIFAALRAQNVETIARCKAEARARELQDTSRAQQCNTGKPSTQYKNSYTTLPTIRPAPVLPEEHQDTADKEDHGQKEATEKAKPTHTHFNRATSTSTSASLPLLTQTRPSRDLDPTRASIMSDIRSLKARLRSRIHTTEVLLPDP